MSRSPNPSWESRVNNHHQNAGATFYSRALIVQRVLKEGKRSAGGGRGLGCKPAHGLQVAGPLQGRRPGRPARSKLPAPSRPSADASGQGGHHSGHEAHEGGFAPDRFFPFHASLLTRLLCCRVSHLCQAAVRYPGARHVRTKPRAFVTSGKAERFIQTCVKGWAYESPEQRSERLAAWLPYHNQARPHTALNYIPLVTRPAGRALPLC